MKKIFYINFVLGSILLLVLFFNLAVVSLTYTFEHEKTYNMNNYIGIAVIDIIFIFVICMVNYKLLNKATECSLKTIIKNVIVPLLIPTVITMLVIMFAGILENTPKQVIVK